MPGVDTRSIVTDSVRNNWRPAVLYFVAPVLLLPMVVMGIVTAFLTFGPHQSAPGPDSAAIPAPDRTSAMMELFDCLRQGPADCPDFQQSVDYLERITEGAFVYTPLHPADPGEPVGDGTVRVRLGGLPQAGASAVGAAVTRDGEALGPTPDLTTVSGNGQELVRFAVGDAQVTVTFALRSESFRLLSITYSAVGGGR